MYVILATIATAAALFLLTMLSFELALLIAVSLIIGFLFRILYVLNTISYTIQFKKGGPEKDKVKQAYKQYMEEKRRRDQREE